MIVLGIDPGLKGGWAVVEDGKYVDGGRMPTRKLHTKRIVDAGELCRVIPMMRYHAAVIEYVGAMPQNSRSSCFSFGFSAGVAYAVAHTQALDVFWVTPQKWKRHHQLLKTDKRGSLSECARTFNTGPDWSVLANDGIAEAALIAQWYLDTQHKIGV